MRKRLHVRLLLMVLAWAAVPARADEEIRKSISFLAGQEFGQLGRFKVIENGEEDKLWFDRFSVSTTLRAEFGEHATASAGFWGTYLFVLPENVSPSFLGSQYKRTYIGPSHGFYERRWGSDGPLAASLKLGMFPFKYNPDAANLGEYLFRSMAYPTVIYTGGLSPSLSATPTVEGFAATLRTGAWRQDFLLTTETTIAPFYDWTATWLATGTFLDGALTVGAGASWTNILPVDPDKTTPKVPVNGYFRENGRLYSGHEDWFSDSLNWYRNYAKYSQARGDTLGAQAYADRAAAAESTYFYGGARLKARTAALKKRSQGESLSAEEAALAALRVEYFTFASIKCMARFTLDPKPLFGSEALGGEDLKVFAEVALLGVKNYPIFYESRWERVPVMFGVNLPAFGFLDRLSFQGEWFGSRNPVSTATVGSYAAPLPSARVYREPDPAAGLFYTFDRYRKDDWKWSLQARKELAPGLSVYAQAARDHFRTYSFVTSYGHGTDPGDILTDDRHWYWLLNFVYGI